MAINGFVIEAIDAFDGAATVSAAGDVNGDGLADIVIGAAGADPNGSGSGESYVVYGSDLGFSRVFRLRDLLPENGGDGTAGFVINGIEAGDFSGGSVSTAGDVNGDGFDDLVVGANSQIPTVCHLARLMCCSALPMCLPV